MALLPCPQLRRPLWKVRYSDKVRAERYGRKMSEARTYPARPDAIARGASAIEVLAGGDFDVTPHIRFTEALAAKLRLDLSATLTVMRHLPLWSGDDAHTGLRRRVAAFLSEDRGEKAGRARQRIDDALTRGLGSAEGVIDLLALIRDCADILMEEVSGLPRPETDNGDLPNIFSSNVGIRARQRLEILLRSRFETARHLYPTETEDCLAMRLGQWMMGRDPLVGTMGLTLHRHLLALDGAPLATRPMPRVPTDTGVPVIGRVARRPTDVSGCPIAAGALVECRLDSLAGSSEADRLRFFGAGAHLCLGRPLALEFLDIVATRLDACRIGLRVTAFERKVDDVFDLPSVFLVIKLPQPDQTG